MSVVTDTIPRYGRTPMSDTNEKSGKRSGLALLALCLGFFMVIMDATVVTTALPAIGRALSSGVSGLQWVVDGYTLVFASLLLSAGSFGDRLGARRVFLLGLAVFVCASVACGLAPGLAVLEGARVVQGVGAALVLPTSLALINASYPDRRRRARAIGVWGGLGGVAAGLGPVLGGVFTTWLGWPSIFYVNVPIGVAALVLTVRFVPSPAPRARTGLDPLGQILAVLTLVLLAFGLIESGSSGWGSPVVLGALVLAVAGGIAFVAAERRHPDPMLPLGLFADREFSGAAVVGVAINLGFYGQIFLLTLYFQQTRQFSPLVAGLAMMPQTSVASVASSVAGRHTARFGARRVMIIGLSVGAAGLLSAMLITATTPYWVLVVPLLAIGFGTSYTMPAATAAIIDAAPTDRAGIASGALNAGRQVGSTLGVAVFGSLVALSSTFLTGYRISVLIGGLVFAGAALVVVLTVPSRQRVSAVGQ
jgi:DHA2 family methylenomycin A resistance protein-like MFS transporter